MSYNNDGDEQERKLFVGGFSKDNTDEDNLKAYFERYGGIIDCTILRDAEKKRSRGFGFILFDDAETVDKIMRDKKSGTRFSLDDSDSYMEVKRALPKSSRDEHSRDRPSFQSRPSNIYNKIFVGGLPSAITEDELRQYFESYGRVNQIELIQDRETKRPRGFAFVSFEDEDSADKCIQRRSHEICRKMCEVKRAHTKENKDSGTNNSDNSGHRSDNSFNNRDQDNSIHNSIQAPTNSNLGSNVNALIQQAFLMGQQSVYQQAGIQPPSITQLNLAASAGGALNSLASLGSAGGVNPLLMNPQQTNNLLLQALSGQQVPRATPPAVHHQQMMAPVAPVPTPAVSNSNDTLTQLAQLLQGGVDPNALGALLKNDSSRNHPHQQAQQAQQRVQQQQPQHHPAAAGASSNGYSTVYPGIYSQTSTNYGPGPNKYEDPKRQFRPY